MASWLLLIFSLGGLSGLTIAVIQADGPLALDLEVHAFIAAQIVPLLGDTRGLLTSAGDMYGILALAFPWVVWLLYRRHWAALAYTAGGLGGTVLLDVLGRTLIGRSSPTTAEYLTTALSYPSVHAATGVVLCGLAAAFIAQELSPSRRYLAYWLAIVLALPLALSHLIVDLYWLSDLIGGALLGLVVCALVRLAWHRQLHAPLTPCPWPWLVVASLILYSVRVVLLAPG